MGCLLLFFLLVHLGRFRRLLIFLLWDSMGGHNDLLVHIVLWGLQLHLEWRAGRFFRFRHFIFIVVFELFIIWVHLLVLMPYYRNWLILLAVNHNNRYFFDFLGKLVKLNWSRLLNEDLLKNFSLLCKSLLNVLKARLRRGDLLDTAELSGLERGDIIFIYRIIKSFEEAFKVFDITVCHPSQLRETPQPDLIQEIFNLRHICLS